MKNKILRYILTLCIDFKYSFKKLDYDTIIFNSIENLYYNYNSKFLFEYLLKNYKNKKVLFVINDVNLKKKLTEEIGDYFIDNFSKANIELIEKSGVWITSSLCYPLLSIFKNKNRIVYHLGHGIPLKKIGLAEEKISFLRRVNRIFRTRLFTDVLCYSENFKPYMMKVFLKENIRYVSLGQPRNDSLIKDNNKSQVFKILYAPTWRNYDVTKFFPFDDLNIKDFKKFLEKNNIIIYLRKHPYYDALIDKEIEKISRIEWLNADKIDNIDNILNRFNILITDYSSIYIDYIIDSKNTIFIPYDIEKYEEKTGFLLNYNRFTPGPKIKTYKEFKDEIIKIIKNTNEFEQERIEIKKILNLKSNNNSQENLEYILSRIKEQKEANKCGNI
ncbi:MAG: CDP-glycerol glycerophosphotransferase family protein [Cetobacterium sp.]